MSGHWSKSCTTICSSGKKRTEESLYTPYTGARSSCRFCRGSSSRQARIPWASRSLTRSSIRSCRSSKPARSRRSPITTARSSRPAGSRSSSLSPNGQLPVSIPSLAIVGPYTHLGSSFANQLTKSFGTAQSLTLCQGHQRLQLLWTNSRS